MLNPFDSEFLSQELRETWKKVEELEKENKELKEEILGINEVEMYYEEIINDLKEENKELREQLEKERELYYGDDDFEDWGRE